jgi:hypothetical protein
MIFMFVTTVAALLYTSFRLFSVVFKGKATVEVLIFNTLMGLVGIFLVVAAIILAVEGWKAFGRYRAIKAQPAPAKA